MCELLSKWGASSTELINLLDTLDIIRDIPPEGIDNVTVEKILNAYEQNIKQLKVFPVQTRDFVLCDVQKRLAG